ncbi:MAG: chemotaxis protein CheW [Deltaproteobacteria bacterium]|nr:chemotaxis protein CheW [Deltaproteobacteria bacterium]
MTEHLKLNDEERKQFEVELLPIRDNLNLKLVMADLRIYKIQGCGEIMNLFDLLLGEFKKFNVPYFERAIGFINELLTEVVTEHISHYTGLSYVLNLYEFLDETLESYIHGEDTFDDFDKALERLQKMFAEKTENLEVEHEEPTEVIQNLPPQDIIDDGLASDFINEATEGIELVESNLMELEQDFARKDLVDQIFRVMHTIKGTAGFLGISTIGKVAHRTEDVLGVVRDGKQEIDGDVISLLFISVDTLKGLVSQLTELIEGREVETVSIQEFFTCLDNLENKSEKRQQQDLPIGAKDLGDQEVLSKIPFDEVEKNRDVITDKIEYQDDERQNLIEKPIEVKKTKVSAQSEGGKASKVVEMLKVPADKLDELSGEVGEMVVALSLLTQNPIIAELKDRSLHRHLDHLEKITESLRDKVLGIRMFPISTIFTKLSRQVRDLSQKSKKEINLEVSGAGTLVDKSIIDNIYAPLMHIVRNSIDHGIEEEKERKVSKKKKAGLVQLSAQHLGDAIMLKITDDGKGLNRDVIFQKAISKGLAKETDKLTDKEVFGFIFMPGFSTAKKITDISGRGVGLDVVTKTVESLRGKINIESEIGKGTTFILKMPLTTSIIEGLVVAVGENRFILPILDVDQTVTPDKSSLKGFQGRDDEFFLLAGDLIPIVRIYRIYHIEPLVKDPSEAVIVVVNDGNKKYGLMVDELIHRQQIVIQNMGERFSGLKGISGGTILGDGRVGLIIDPVSFIQKTHSFK